jgi:hypothetical protein
LNLGGGGNREFAELGVNISDSGVSPGSRSRLHWEESW